VFLARTQNIAKAIIEAFMGLNADILVLEYIKEAGGAGICRLVVGEKVITVMKRQAAEGGFRSNVHRGCAASVVEPSPAECKTEVDTAKTMGLNMYGVDILHANSGPVSMEVDSSPGLGGINIATIKDVDSIIIQFLEKNAIPNNNKIRGKG
jgi:ribosomal protein S6--L-glutamate ligase